MAPETKKVQWCNATQNHQNGKPLPVLDPKIKGYEPMELYQWEMCMPFHSRDTLEIIPTTDAGDKIRNLIVKLHKTHRKDFSIFTEYGKLIQLEMFLKRHQRLRSS
eukprot:9465289-Ditylum_brightwellii.AAC.1